MTKATLLKGWGFWETTHLPYGGAFRRAQADMPVTVTGPKVRCEYPVTYGDNQRAIVDARALRFEAASD